jgi:hypothetical protein
MELLDGQGCWMEENWTGLLDERKLWTDERWAGLLDGLRTRTVLLDEREAADHFLHTLYGAAGQKRAGHGC